MLKVLLLLILLGFCHTPGKAHDGHLHGECCQRNRQPIRMGINCKDHTYLSPMRLHGNFWILYNYICANPGYVRCCTTVTYCFHVDFCYLNNMLPQAKRWQTRKGATPHAPRDKGLLWLRQCSAEHELIQQWIRFHIYFHVEHISGIVPNEETMTERSLDCSDIVPRFSIAPQIIYGALQILRCPINVDRNIANIELYPLPALANGIMQMLYISILNIVEPKRSVLYSIFIFQISKDTRIPDTKCPIQRALVPSDNRIDCKHWEPIYMGTVNVRLSWADMSNKLTQPYTLCLMGYYEFHMIENSFPGIKTRKESDYRLDSGLKTHQKLAKQIPVEYIEKYVNKSNYVT